MPRTLPAALVFAAVILPSVAAQDANFFVAPQKRIAVTETVNVGGKDVATTRYRPATFTATIDPKKAAVIVCDMWDDHWCKAASKRCGELAKAAEPVLQACRDRGMTVIHAPSDCMEFYKDHAARKRMLAVKKLDKKDLPREKELPNPALPVDDSDGGCDDDKPAKQHKAWTRQHAAITIDDAKDYVSDSGVEVYSLMKEKGIHTLFVMGVHTNMCVLNRSFAIKQMVKWGVATYLVRDLTDAMYNPKMKPFVTHEQGTNLIIEHIEAHWCPTVLSKELKAK